MASKTRSANRTPASAPPPAPTQTKKAAKEAKKRAREAQQAEGASQAAALEAASRKKVKKRLKTPGSVYDEDLGVDKVVKRRPVEDSAAPSVPNRKRRALEPAASSDGSDVEEEQAPAPKRKPAKRSKSDFLDLEDEEADVINPRRGLSLFLDSGDEGDGGAAEFEESADSSEEFEPEGDSEDEDEEGEEDEDEEDDEPKTKKTKKVKTGVAMRARVRDLREDDSPIKRRATKVQKSKSTKGKDGARPNWKKARGQVLLREPDSRSIKELQDDPENDFEDGGPFQQAGEPFEGEDDVETERQAMISSSSKKSTATVVPLVGAPRLVKKGSAFAPGSNGKLRAKVQYIPPQARPYWKYFKAIMIDMVSSMEPWAELTVDIIAKAWEKLVNGEPGCEVSTNAADGPAYELLMLLVSLIVNQVIPTEWKNKLGEAGIDAVTSEWERRGIQDSPELITQFANMMLGPNPSDRKSKNRPFMWAATDKLDWDGQDPNKCGGGLFFGRMVLKVVATHMDIVGVLEDSELSLRPSGLLMMAAQAVARALEYSLSGSMKVPKGDKTGYFSRDNWGDYDDVVTTLTGKRVKKVVKRASVFAKEVASMDDSRWIKFLAAAAAYRSKKETKRKVRAAIESAEESEESDVIIDSMFATPSPRPVPTLSSSPRRNAIASSSSSSPRRSAVASGSSSSPRRNAIPSPRRNAVASGSSSSPRRNAGAGPL